MNVPFYRHNLNQNCYKEALSKVLENEFLTTGPICREVQSSLEDYFSIASCILTSSWTSGAQALLRYLKQELLDQKESTVLTTSMTFCATANVALNEGYNIQLLDISRETLHPSFEDIILSVNNNPTIKIVIFVHLYGYYTDLSLCMNIYQPRMSF